MKTVAQAVRGAREIRLPGGEAVRIRRLRMLDQDHYYYTYALLLNFLTGMWARNPETAETPLTLDDIRENLPDVLMSFYARDRRAEAAHIKVLEWLQLFAPALTVEMVDELQREDVAALIKEIMEDNPHPFALINPMVWEMQTLLLHPLLAAASVASSDSSTEPA